MPDEPADPTQPPSYPPPSLDEPTRLPSGPPPAAPPPGWSPPPPAPAAPPAPPAPPSYTPPAYGPTSVRPTPEAPPPAAPPTGPYEAPTMMRPPGSTPQPAPPQQPAGNGWSAGPDGQAYGGYQTASGYSGTYATAAGGSGRGVLYTLLTVCVVALAAIVTSVVLLTTGGDDAQAAAGDGDTTVTDPATDDPTTEPTTEPTDDPSASATAPVEPPTTSTAPEPEPTDPPTTKDPAPPPAEPGSPFSYTEYGDNWNFRIGDVALQASFQQGWDYDTCKPVERDGALTDLGCVRASEWTLRALRDKVAMTHIVLTFDSPAQAKKAIKQKLIGPDTFTVEPNALLDDPKRSNGTYVADFVSGAPYVVMTIETHSPRITQDTADDYTHYGTADIQGALAFRDAFG